MKHVFTTLFLLTTFQVNCAEIFASTTDDASVRDTFKKTTDVCMDQRNYFSTGNLSVFHIQHSPIGAIPDPNFVEPIPSIGEFQRYRKEGVITYEDYIAWGTVEKAEGQWDFSRHREMAENQVAAGMNYRPYIWCHVPPVWLRDDPRATCMVASPTNKKTYMFSICDPRTLDWYERFYRAMNDALGNLIHSTYACVLGPYGEGNYPLPILDWLELPNMDERFRSAVYWCNDPYALPAFQKAMRHRYHDISELNNAWGTRYDSFVTIHFPQEINMFNPPALIDASVTERRRWLDFIYWYHQELIDFTGHVIDRIVPIFGKHRVLIKPGGNSGWMNPVSWGTYNPGFAKMLGEKGISVQSADARGAYWADKWTSTAYHYYGVPYKTEAASNVTPETFQQRVFSDASCGSAHLFTYEADKHLPQIKPTVHLYNGKRAKTDIGLLAPTTLYYLNADPDIYILPYIHNTDKLRDLFDFDVLDELLIRDGALLNYRVLVAIECNVIEQQSLDKILEWVSNGGCLLWASAKPVETVEKRTDWPINKATSQGIVFGEGQIVRISSEIDELVKKAAVFVIKGNSSLDGLSDNVWMSEFENYLLCLNRNQNEVTKTIKWRNSQKTFSFKSGWEVRQLFLSDFEE